jgi:hypothetical protein
VNGQPARAAASAPLLFPSWICFPDGCVHVSPRLLPIVLFFSPRFSLFLGQGHVWTGCLDRVACCSEPPSAISAMSLPGVNLARLCVPYGRLKVWCLFIALSLCRRRVGPLWNCLD